MRRVGLLLVALCTVGMLFSALPRLDSAAAPKPAKDVVYITKSGKKFHRAKCRTLARSKVKKPILRQDAIKKGYTACKVCKP
jgi:hypothetical protein